MKLSFHFFLRKIYQSLFFGLFFIVKGFAFDISPWCSLDEFEQVEDAAIFIGISE